MLAAALSAPIALLHATLHDVAASLSFQAAVAAATSLTEAGGWAGRLSVAAGTKLLDAGIRIEAWPGVTLARDADSQHCVPAGWAVEIGTHRRKLVVRMDPDLEHLWHHAGVSNATGHLVLQPPALNTVTCDVDALLEVCYCHSSPFQPCHPQCQGNTPFLSLFHTLVLETTGVPGSFDNSQ
jgi:hypothetical protein